ncbi:thioredoxin family protein [Maricaulis parjimensis]|uniref:thioredoxin family protein n=1 Tax=Maricaulis parjimensis TaxID=144023 RepID=UPI00193A95F4|nr:thioredoxin family protein [Maricaulis parjimensis]
MRLIALFSFLLVLIPTAWAEDDHPRPFDQNFNAMPVVDEALAEARDSDKRLLLVLGANWCHDSRGLAHHFEDPELAATIAENYVLRYIDVGWRSENQAVSSRFGVPAVYATPTVLVIDPESETLLNREDRTRWGSAASTPIEDARDWFARWAHETPSRSGVLESSLVYQAMLVEIDIFEEEEAERLAAAYRDIAVWREAPAPGRPPDFDALEREVESWRRSLPRQVQTLRGQARSLVAGALSEMAGDEPLTPEIVAQFDLLDPDLALDFERHESEVW